MIYLVDDDPDDLEIIQEALTQYNYHGAVNSASNGQVLIDHLNNSDASEKPDVIVLDINLPMKDGFEVLQEIKNNPSLKNIPVIILTASFRKQDEIRCFELGCHFFYTKPRKFSEYRDLVSIVKKLTVNRDTSSQFNN